MFDDESIQKWCNSLTGRDKAYVKFIVRNYQREHDYNTSIWEALIYARKAVILRDAINVIAYTQCKTPREVYNELKASKG
jgi:hypothetical protein